MKDFKEIIRQFQSFDNDILGDEIWAAIDEPNNYAYDMAKYAKLVVDGCMNEREFEIADEMFTAITGWRIRTIIERMKKK